MRDIEIFDNQHETGNSDGLSGILGVATKTHQMYELVIKPSTCSISLLNVHNNLLFGLFSPYPVCNVMRKLPTVPSLCLVMLFSCIQHIEITLLAVFSPLSVQSTVTKLWLISANFLVN